MNGQYLSRGIALVISLSFILVNFQFPDDIVPKSGFLMVWLTGWFCWLYLFIFRIFSLTWQNGLIAVVLVYVSMEVIFLSRSDANSVHLLFHLFSLAGIFLFLVDTMNTHMFMYSYGLLLSFMIQIGLGGTQAFAHGFDPLLIKGTFSNSGHLSNYLLSAIPFCCAALWNKRCTRFQKVFLSLLLLSIGTLIVLCRSRAAMSGILFAAAVWLTGWLYLKKGISKRYALWIVASGITLLIVFCVVSYGLKTNSANGRLTIYSVTLEIIKDHPIFGIGPGRFPAVYNGFQSAYFAHNAVPQDIQLLATDTYEAFNWFLQLWAELGIVGVGMAAYILWVLIKRLFKRDYSQLELIGISTLAALLCAGLFSNPFHLPGIDMIVACSLAVLLSKDKQYFIKELESSATRKYYLLAIFSVVSFFFWRNTYIKFNSWKAWTIARQNILYGEKDLNVYKVLYPDLSRDGQFLYNFGAEAYIAGNYRLSISLLEEARKYYSSSNLYSYLADAYMNVGSYKEAEKAYYTCRYMVPALLYPKHQLMELYLRTGDTSRAIQIIREALKYPVKINSSYTNRLKANMSATLKELTKTTI